jgi:hypothetical protein
MNEDERVWIICDEDNIVLHIRGVDIMGNMVTLPGIFLNEEDALNVLFACENTGVLNKPNMVKAVKGTLQ